MSSISLLFSFPNGNEKAVTQANVPLGVPSGTAGKEADCSPGVGEQCIIMEILSKSSPSGRK